MACPYRLKHAGGTSPRLRATEDEAAVVVKQERVARSDALRDCIERHRVQSRRGHIICTRSESEFHKVDVCRRENMGG